MGSVGVAFVIAVVGGAQQTSPLAGGLQSILTIEDKPDPTPTSARFAPLAWSPVRRELAFGGTVGGAESVLPPGWLLPSTERAFTSADPQRQGIWVAPPGETHADLVAVSAGLFSAPCWAPDGDSLFFVRWEPGDAGEGKFALVRQYRSGKTEVVITDNGRFPFTQRQLLPFETAAASPDGLLVAVPWLTPRGLAVVNLEDNTIVRVLEGASAPSWSVDSRQLAFFLVEGGSSSIGFAGASRNRLRNSAKLIVADRDELYAKRPSLPVGKEMGEFDGAQPVRWDQTGHTLLALRSLIESPASFEPSKVQLFRVTVGEGRAARLLSAASAEYKANPPASSFAFDPRSDALFLCTARPDARMMIEQYDLSSPHTETAWHPFEEIDSPLPPPLGALALSADGKRLAFRFGKPEIGAPVAVWNADADRSTPLHTDDAGDLRTAAVFTAAARRTFLRAHPEAGTNYQMTLPGAWDSGREHPHRLAAFPRRAKLAGVDDVRLLAVRRLAADGLAFVADRRRPLDANRTKSDACFDELSLQLHYFREEFDHARRRVDRLTLDQPMPAERRVMLAILRAQCLEATAGPGLARFSLEPILESGLLQKLRSRDAEGGPHPFVRRIEELCGAGAVAEKPTDEE